MPGEAAEGARTCFRAFLADRGTVGSREDAQAAQQLREFISRFGMSRFDLWATVRPDPGPEATVGQDASAATSRATGQRSEHQRSLDRVGWRKWIAGDQGGGAWRYYLTDDGMRIVLKGQDYRAATKSLAAAGLIIPSKAAGDVKRGVLAASLTPPGGKARLYEIADNILDWDTGDAG
jgi:hypothetical protein